jgi:AcrR family transcriptional regulator
MARTRSETAHRKVIDAALELVADRGVEGASMDAIAAKSGVSKATIYKHWEDKDALLLEMIAVLNGLRSRPTFDSGDTRADMVAVLAYHPEENADMRERILPHFVAYSAANKKFGNAWRNRVMEPPRRELTHLIQQGVAKGELASGLENDLCLALLLGPILYWHMFLRINKADPQALAQGVVDVFWKAFGLKRSRTPQR